MSAIETNKKKFEYNEVQFSSGLAMMGYRTELRRNCGGSDELEQDMTLADSAGDPCQGRLMVDGSESTQSGGPEVSQPDNNGQQQTMEC